MSDRLLLCNETDLQRQIFQRLDQSRSIAELLVQTRNLQAGAGLAVRGAVGSSTSLVIAKLAASVSRSILVVCPDELQAKNLAQDCAEWSPDRPLIGFPSLGDQMWSEIGPALSLVGRRLDALHHLLDSSAPIVVTSVESLAEKIADPHAIRDGRRLLRVGEDFDFANLIERLISMGYVREERVDQPGEISVRGGLIDIYLVHESTPVRIEFFGDTIESVREFDVETQRSTGKRSFIDILPLSAAGPFCPHDEQILGHLPPTCSILDFLAPDTLVLSLDADLIELEWQQSRKTIEDAWQAYLSDHKTVQVDLNQLYCLDPEPPSLLHRFARIDFLALDSGSADLHLSIEQAPSFHGNIAFFLQELERQINQSSVKPLAVVLGDSAAQTERLQAILKREDNCPDLCISAINISEGFIWPEVGLFVFTNKELFNRRRLHKLDSLETRPVSFQELLKLKNGDFVVHVDYGIGLYRGLKTIDAYGKERECLIVEYRDGDTLYVPLEKMDCVQKYTSKESTLPTLSKLGSAEWQRLKSRTKQQVKEIAEKLIKLYAVRQIKKGHAFSGDAVWQNELEAAFAYDETVDQLNAIQEIKKDMQSERPMDRLICGDVGFGKTEVAIRAAFKAINDGKQVAVLVPTTVLAQQHYQTFRSRLAPFPVEIGVLSRFLSPRRQRQTIKDIAAGRIDLVVGTHRLLSGDIQFSDLGLLIVDEEQKFGVLQKEKLKLWKENVDTLSLSATPIPRTMQMALMGARDMSIINTPPHNRIPVKTEVVRFDRELIRDAILREINRGGQVFFVHNRVQSIHAIAALLRELLPEVAFGISHGQMESAQLEKVMLAFMNGEIQCLITTMIIESGIDVPNANTLIVNRADRFGLSQLYQLKGRVGRSFQQAFAYFLIPPLRRLNRTAVKRLQAIQEYSHLGSGYKIAARDLEIRGAGNIFGARQSGFVDALGYEMYMKIIEEAINELRGELVETEPEEKAPPFEPRVEVHTDAYLPDSYVAAPSERIDFYKKLVLAKNLSDIAAIRQEIQDRFGPLPVEARHLIAYIEIKVLARQTQLQEIILTDHRLRGKFHSPSLPTGEEFRRWIGRWIEIGGERLTLKQEKNDLLFELRLDKTSEPVEQIKNFLHNAI
ncbi:transcription-repair coupling factor [candidate division KSB1 bacterium]|nr:transcription-repair coupling factor [candidate division KSB1 bacterium]